MKLGLNLSFATKRWTEPEQLAKMCKEDFGVENIQFTWDLIDPWWPEENRDVLIEEYKNAFQKNGLSIDATFGGLASYSYSQLLAPSENQREISYEFFKRAIDLTVLMGADVMGTPVGGMSYNDARNEERRKELYNIMIDYIRKLASYGKQKGLKEIHIESVPLATEFPSDYKECIQMMQDLEGTTDIPVKLLLDWGHVLYKPLFKEEADIELWFNECAPYIGSIHLQQTDGMLDRHWDFTKEGIVTPELIKRVTKNAGLDDVVQYLEVVSIFEDRDENVYEGMKKTMDYLHSHLGC